MSKTQKAKLPEPLNRCPFCTEVYLDSAIVSMGRKKDCDLTHATCARCFRAMQFAISRQGSHVACVGVITDCNATEAANFDRLQKISLDEVLSVHVKLHA